MNTWGRILIQIVLALSLPKISQAKLSRPTPDELVDGARTTQALKTFFTINSGYTYHFNELVPLKEKLEKLVLDGNPKNGAFEALDQFIEELEQQGLIRESQRKLHQEALDHNGGRLFICLRDLVRSQQSKESVDFVAATLKKLSLNPHKAGYLASIKWDCLEKYPKPTKWTPEDWQDLNIQPLVSHLTADPILEKVRALIHTFFFPKLVACNEFSVTEVGRFEDQVSLPWRWGLSVCVREDGAQWRETLKGFAGESLEVNSPISSAIQNILDDYGLDPENEDVPEELKEDEPGALKKLWKAIFVGKDWGGSSFLSNGGVTYRWQKWREDDRQISKTEQDYDPLLFTDAIYSCVRDERFYPLNNKFSNYATDFGAYTIPGLGGLTEPKAYIYENSHRHLYDLLPDGTGIYRRFFHSEFKFYPFGKDPDEENLIRSSLKNQGTECSLE